MDYDNNITVFDPILLAHALYYFDHNVLDLSYLRDGKIGSENGNIPMIIGFGYQDIIDQLSISHEAKTSDRVLLDATVVGYYPLDDDTKVTGVVRDDLNFTNFDGYYQARGFTILDIPSHAWIQSQNQSGIFPPIASSMACLLVLSI
ncbi:unnamed protein product [Rotaria sordida]|uniref:Uncharacterized protein n=1 Tax=Rotaria sordida TaxID=392033 RepID=A0A819RSF6_9BILA|nr:unnamed protein product [Rotaria sordida]CAF4042692.1 unnamed protein product [Rotaria sordida]